jgi:tRNA A-37 threonylcarbamoyl transferase component Bud32
LSTTPKRLPADGADAILADCVHAVLARHEATGWQVEPGDFWCHVRPPRSTSRQAGIQGWKLHVSATVLSAPHVLARSADVLVRHGCAFKFAHTLDDVRLLTSGTYDRGGGGKFITVYPHLDEAGLRELAGELHEATEGLPGPRILSDRPFRPRSLVHYRFGVFHGLPMLGNDGSYEAMLVDPAGTPVRDRREAWFVLPGWAPRDPFRADADAEQTPGRAGGVLLGARYAVRAAIRHALKGGVYRATDELTGDEVIVKQARAHVGAGIAGTDVRDALRREAALLETFAPTGITPRPLGLFEQQEDLFLVQEAIDGVTLRAWARENVTFHDDGGWGPPPEEVARMAGRLVELLSVVHGHGLVFQDFTPNNVMVTGDGDLRLIDLELAARPGEIAVRSFTRAYGAPEQIGPRRTGAAPAQAVDLFALGATLFYLASGVDPLLAPDRPATRPARDRLAAWLGNLSATNASVRRLRPVITALLDDDPDRRPGLNEVRRLLDKAGTEVQPPPKAPSRAGTLDTVAHDRLITDGLAYLVDTMEQESQDRLWPVGPADRTSDPHNVQYGAAGVLGVLTRAYGSRQDPALRDGIEAAARWIARGVAREPRMLPGLQFGRSGTAWALLEAGRSLGDERFTGLAADLARRTPAHWPNPDVCHGVAGFGLTQLRFWELTGEDDFLDRARHAASDLVKAARLRDGHVQWPIPEDFSSQLASVVHYGFAHGTAGIGAFLLAAGRVLGADDCLDLAGQAAGTLASVARLEQGAAYWSSGPGDNVPMTQWCSGSAGVGAFLVRMWQHGGDDRLLELARQAGLAVLRSRWFRAPGQCCGLSGGGELLLDLAEATGSAAYRDRAGEIAAALHAGHVLRDGRLLIADAAAEEVPAHYGNGLAGVLAFLIRLRDGGPRLWLPDALTRMR